MNTSSRSGTLYLSGLRGYSALAVFIIHSGGGGFRHISAWANKLVDFGKYGVISFFVLSAFTLAMSIERSKKFSYTAFLKRRFARIFPMYSLAVILFWVLGGLTFYQTMFHVPQHDWMDLLAHLTFLNIWDVRYQNTTIGVEWSVPIEMWTYLVIPVMFFGFNRLSIAWNWVLFFAAVGLSLVSKYWHTTPLGNLWSIEAYLYCFIGGMIAYRYWMIHTLRLKVADYLIWLLLALICGLALYGGRGTAQAFTLLVMALILCLSEATYMRVIFENRVAVFFGDISFSFYLLHNPILRYLQSGFTVAQSFFLGLGLAAIAAYACYWLIEQPFLLMASNRSRAPT